MLKRLKHIDNVLNLYPDNRVRHCNSSSYVIRAKNGLTEFIINASMIKMMIEKQILDLERTEGTKYDYKQILGPWVWLEEWVEDVEWLEEKLFEI